MSAGWNRQEALRELRRHLWRYLSASATVSSLQGIVEDIWRLQPGDLRRLAATHMGLQPVTEAMIRETPKVLWNLRSSVERRPDEQLGRVDGPVLWGPTMHRRWQTGLATLFVTRPAERRYDTVEARLIRLCLAACTNLRAQSELAENSDLGQQLAELSRTARHLLSHAKLQQATEVADLPERTLGMLERRGLHTFVAFWRSYRDAVRELRAEGVAEVVQRQLLAPAKDADLFELLVGFRLLDLFQSRGLTVQFGGLIPDRGHSFATVSGDQLDLAVWWQRSPWGILPSWSGYSSTYHDVLDAARMTRSTLRPDFLLDVVRPRPETLLVETKHTSREGVAPDRAGVFDALAYLRDGQQRLINATAPHALVVAQNSDARPALREVMVSGPDSLADVVDLLLDVWR